MNIKKNKIFNEIKKLNTGETINVGQYYSFDDDYGPIFQCHNPFILNEDYPSPATIYELIVEEQVEIENIDKNQRYGVYKINYETNGVSEYHYISPAMVKEALDKYTSCAYKIISVDIEDSGVNSSLGKIPYSLTNELTALKARNKVLEKKIKKMPELKNEGDELKNYIAITKTIVKSLTELQDNAANKFDTIDNAMTAMESHFNKRLDSLRIAINSLSDGHKVHIAFSKEDHENAIKKNTKLKEKIIIGDAVCIDEDYYKNNDINPKYDIKLFFGQIGIVRNIEFNSELGITIATIEIKRKGSLKPCQLKFNIDVLVKKDS